MKSADQRLANVLKAIAFVAVFVLALSGTGHVSAQSASGPRIDDALATALAGEASDDLVVLAGAATARAARKAVHDAGLRTLEVFERIAVVAASGSPDRLRRLVADESLDFVDLDRSVTLALDTSHKVTRGQDVIDGFTATTTVRKNKKSKPKTTSVAIPPLTGKGVSIAVIDGGVDGSHPFFAEADGTSKVVLNLKSICYLDRDCDAVTGLDRVWVPVPGNDSDTMSIGGHGTSVAGTAAGRRGLVDGIEPFHGAAPGAKIIGLSIGGGTLYATTSAMNWVVEHHADPCGSGDLVKCPPIRVVNNSWGSLGAFEPGDAYDRLQTAMVGEGITVVWAAGNSGGDGSEDLTTKYAKTPLPGILNVAAYTDADMGTRAGTTADFSSRGHAGHPSTYPDLAAPGDWIASSCPARMPYWCSPWESKLEYAPLSGTSLAAPHVAGIVAQLLEADPTLTPGQIEELLEDTAFEFPSDVPFEPDPLNEGGDATSFDRGHGLVDAKAAVARLFGANIPASVVPSGIPCTGGGKIGIDPTRDTDLFGGITLVYSLHEPSIDVRSLDAAWDAAAGILRFTIEVEELDVVNPPTVPNASWGVTFGIGSKSYFVYAARSRMGDTTFGAGESISNPSGFAVRLPVVAASGALDPTADTITLELSVAALEELGASIGQGTTLSAITYSGRRALASNTGALPPNSDGGAAGCEFTLA